MRKYVELLFLGEPKKSNYIEPKIKINSMEHNSNIFILLKLEETYKISLIERKVLRKDKII